MSKLKVGDKVHVDSFEGFGGEGTVVEILPLHRPEHEHRVRVDLPSAGWAKPGVCWAHEIVELRDKTMWIDEPSAAPAPAPIKYAQTDERDNRP